MSWIVGGVKHGNEEDSNLGIDWVLQYDFSELDQTEAIAEYRSLVQSLTNAGLRVQVRHGHGSSLLVCIHVPRDQLGRMVHQSRIKDWLFGITSTIPAGPGNTIAAAETPSEEIRSVYHAVTWSESMGGAGITPGFGKWKRVTASFPLHDQDACSELLSKWNRKGNLTMEDLDAIRALFGEKVAFYFAFIHCYSLFLMFPAALGIFVWWFLGPYSIVNAVLLCAWCVVFVEYWKLREFDLSVRWKVDGVGQLKVNRAQYRWEKEVKDPVSGEVKHIFPAWKQIMRQFLLLPFTGVASLALGTLIVATFAGEIFISEVYNGPLKSYLEFVPTVLFSLSLPAITSFLTGIAGKLTEYENYRTQDLHDLAYTQKTFIMHIITSFLPTILTAYVYVPFGHQIVPKLDLLRRLGMETFSNKEFVVDTSRFQAEVIYLSVTAQVFSFAEEIVLPYVKHVLWQKWQNYREHKAGLKRQRSFSKTTDLLLIDPPQEVQFLRRLRSEAGADEYKVEEDILEMCVQFGYLALFGVAWPLVPLGFLLNNWLEVRGDFFKLTLECQRPPPIRADSIGPCVLGLDFLAWLGTLSTAAIVHIYRGSISEVRLSSLLLTLFIAEQLYLAMRFVAAAVLRKILDETLSRDEAGHFAVRKAYLETQQARYRSPDSSTRVRQRVRFHERVDVYSSDTTVSPEGSPSPSPTTEQQPLNEDLRGSDREADFWDSRQCEPIEAGSKIIRALSESKVQHESKGEKRA